jgi:hypothetical protein
MARYLVFIVMDGVRYTEAIGTPANIPNIWALKSQGTLLSNLLTTGDLTQTCVTHTALMTGVFEDGVLRDPAVGLDVGYNAYTQGTLAEGPTCTSDPKGAMPNDGTRPPYYPGFIHEWFRAQYRGVDPTHAPDPNSAKMIFSKAKLYMLRDTNITDCGYDWWLGLPDPRPVPYTNAGVNGDGTGGDRDDSDTHTLFKAQCLGASPPTISVVSYASADKAAHTGNWANYISAIQTIDSYIGEIVSLVNSHPLMAGNTTFVVTTDHGRKADPDWQTHGTGTFDERHCFLVASGPDVKQDYESEALHLTEEVASTALCLAFGTDPLPVAAEQEPNWWLDPGGWLIAGGCNVAYTQKPECKCFTLGRGFISEAFVGYADAPVVDCTDYFTEQFNVTTKLIDLANTSFTFTPDGNNCYTCCRESISEFWVTPTDETDLQLPPDSYIEIILPSGKTISFFGTSHDRLFVGSNGYVTFGTGDTSYSPSFSSHFKLPRISGAFADFGSLAGTSYGGIFFVELSNKIVVTWKDMIHIPGSGISTDQSDFQVEIFFDGRIRLSFLRAATIPCVSGLSPGGGIPGGFIESDLTSYPRMPTAVSALEGGAMTSEKIRLQWLDQSEFEQYYVIERRRPGGEWEEIKQLPAGEHYIPFVHYVHYDDSDRLEPSTNYEYRVFTRNDVCVSDPTNAVVVQTRPAPAAPSPPPAMPHTINPIRQDEVDQLFIGAKLSMQQKSRQWNAMIGSEWYVHRITEGTPRKIHVRPLDPNHAYAEWTTTEAQLREHFKIVPVVPGPPSKMAHI